MTPEVLRINVEATKREVAISTAPVILRAKALTVTDAPSYAQADALLLRLRDARKQVKARIATVLDPINQARAAILALSHDLDDPLEAAEQRIRVGMQEFKRLEMRQAQEAERKRQAEEEALRMEAADKHMRELAAKTEPMRQRLAAQRAELEEKADNVVAAPVLPPVKAAHSSTRTVRKWRVTDEVALLRAAADLDSDVPENAMMADPAILNQWLKEYPEELAKWPGIEIFDDIVIVGGRK
jgi:hypothetical protein